MAATRKTRRRQVAAGRRNRVAVTLTDGELAAYRAAAAADGLAVAAWLARAGNDKAGGLPGPASAELRKAVAGLDAVARQVQKAGRLLNKAVARLNSTGAPGPELTRAIRRSEHALAAIDEATLAVTDALP